MPNAKPQKTIGIGLVGLGTVGTGVVKILKSQAGRLARKTGVRLALRKICVRSLHKKRSVRVDRRLLTRNPQDLLRDPRIQIVIELAGGMHPAKEIIQKALRSGRHVVTANKALLAEHGKIIYHQAQKYRRFLGIEASVCGGIPIIQTLQEGLASNSISQILGIVNGTCNFILSAMAQDSIPFDAAVKAAQKKGYAESNPTLDIDGTDSAHKLAILARLAFQSEIPFASIHVEGIQSLSSLDIAYAKELGYAIKLLAIGKRQKEGLELRVHPTLLAVNHPLASVWGVYNAVFVHADQAGDLLLYGQGAGERPAASAVMSDVLAIAHEISLNSDSLPRVPSELSRKRIIPMDQVVSKYYLRFQVADKPGILGKIARTLGRHGISILSVHQKESHDPRSVPVIVLTYAAIEKNLRHALKTIDAFPEVAQKTIALRLEK